MSGQIGSGFGVIDIGRQFGWSRQEMMKTRLKAGIARKYEGNTFKNDLGDGINEFWHLVWCEEGENG